MIGSGPHPFAPVFIPLRALHTPEGCYVELDEGAFLRIGIDTAPLLGRHWQEFTPGADVDVEAQVIRRAIGSGRPQRLPEVCRRWSGRAVRLAVTVTPVFSRGGAPLILRNALLLADPRDTADPVDGPMSALQALARC